MVDTKTIVLTDVFRNSDYNHTFQHLDGTTPINITDYDFEFHARAPGSSTNAVDKVMSNLTAASGLFALTLDPSDTALLTGPMYVYQITGTTDTGEEYVFVEGEFEVKTTY
jgi:hypothetical protein